MALPDAVDACGIEDPCFIQVDDYMVERFPHTHDQNVGWGGKTMLSKICWCGGWLTLVFHPCFGGIKCFGVVDGALKQVIRLGGFPDHIVSGAHPHTKCESFGSDVGSE